jgi:hypothetical protein
MGHKQSRFDRKSTAKNVVDAYIADGMDFKGKVAIVTGSLP